MEVLSGVRHPLVGLLGITVVFLALWAAGRGWVSHFLFILFYLLAVSVYLAFRLKRHRGLFYNLSFGLLALAVFEGYLNWAAFSGGAIHSGSYAQGGYFTPDPFRGYGAHAKQAQYTSTLRRKTGEPIYDVVYSIGANGLRVTPAATGRTERPAWFFGCSFTFGEGVGDAQTLPAAYAKQTGVESLNFGFHGYGPHQMLRMLETGHIVSLDRREPSFVFYNAISVHVERAAGLVSWDKDGPRYLPTESGAQYAGTFSDGTQVLKYLDKILDKSLTYQQIFRPRIFVRRAPDMDRYLGIVKQSAKLARDKYQAQFVVVLWDVFKDRSAESDVDSDLIARELSKSGIPVVRVSAALGTSDYKRFYIEGDGHPSALGYAKVAELLLNRGYVAR